MSKDKITDQPQKEKKVISIYNGKPVDAEAPEVSEAVVAVLQTLTEQAYAGNISQILVVTMNDDSVTGSRVIAGETVNPEVAYVQLTLMADDYKEIFFRPYDYFDEGIDDE
jgi:Na+-translocating ferredoxin:NAD+ oxidoreductase RnfG subunit